MKDRFSDPIGSIYLNMAQALSGVSFAPNRPSASVPPPAAPRLSLLERFDRWAWKQEQREREAYLARAQDLGDLERRMRELESCARGWLH